MIKQSLKRIKLVYQRLKYSRNNTLSSVFSIGRKVTLNHCTIGYHSRIAEQASLQYTYIGEYSAIGRYTKIVHTEIGKYCAISWDTTINAISHPYTHLSISAFPYVPHVGNFVEERTQSYQKVSIKNDVWIGANSVILPGITIGNGAIVGAGAVVTRDVPDYAIVVGTPAEIIKYRFSKETIDILLSLRWWDLEVEAIKNNINVWKHVLDDNALERLKEICK